MFRAVGWFVLAVAYVQPLEALVSQRPTTADVTNFYKNLGSKPAIKVHVKPKTGTTTTTSTTTISRPPALSNIHSYYSSGRVGLSNNASGWPLTGVSFNHPIQSPVDLITSKAVTMNLPTLDIITTNMDGVKAKFYNSGHTVYIYIEEDVSLRPYLVGGPLKDKFVFEQLHFHWGDEDIWGSEHFIDGESFAVEIHMVHWNSKYVTYEKAATQKDGLAVLTIFAEAQDTANPLLEPLHKLLPNVTQAKSYVKLDSWQAIKWVASALSVNSDYYTYPGSLTTDPYTENVVFILLPLPIKLSHSQLSAFRNIHNDENTCVKDNKRKLQPLHNRPIVRSVNLQ